MGKKRIERPAPAQLELMPIIPPEFAGAVTEANKAGARALLRGEVGKCLDYWNLVLHLAGRGGNNEHKDD